MTQEEIAEHFGPTAPVVLTPPDFDSIRAGQPWTTVKYKGGDSDGTVSITSTTGGAFDVNVVVDGNGLILGMAITPTKDVHVPAASWQELEAAVKALPAPTNLTVTEVTEGKNAEVFSVGDTSPQPTGSTIKLYVRRGRDGRPERDTLLGSEAHHHRRPRIDARRDHAGPAIGN